MNKLKQWMKAASTAQQEQLAKMANTSRKVLYHTSSGRNTSAAKAILIEKAAARVKGAVALPQIKRTDLCATCRKCDYARTVAQMEEELSQ